MGSTNSDAVALEKQADRLAPTKPVAKADTKDTTDTPKKEGD